MVLFIFVIFPFHFFSLQISQLASIYCYFSIYNFEMDSTNAI
jgi:hypothetical protein